MFLMSRSSIGIARGTAGRHLSRLPSSGKILGRGVATSDVASALQTITVPVRSLGELVVTQERGAPPVIVELATSWRDDCAYSPEQVSRYFRSIVFHLIEERLVDDLRNIPITSATMVIHCP